MRTLASQVSTWTDGARRSVRTGEIVCARIYLRIAANLALSAAFGLSEESSAEDRRQIAVAAELVSGATSEYTKKYGGHHASH